MPVAVHNPENYCPICGCYFSQPGEHRCNSRTLTAIDAACKQDHDQARTPSMADRFKAGFESCQAEDESDDQLELICYVPDEAEIFHWF